MGLDVLRPVLCQTGSALETQPVLIISNTCWVKKMKKMLYSLVDKLSTDLKEICAAEQKVL